MQSIIDLSPSNRMFPRGTSSALQALLGRSPSNKNSKEALDGGLPRTPPFLSFPEHGSGGVFSARRWLHSPRAGGGNDRQAAALTFHQQVALHRARFGRCIDAQRSPRQ